VPTNLNEFCPAFADGFKTSYRVESEIKWGMIQIHTFLVFSCRETAFIIVFKLLRLEGKFLWCNVLGKITHTDSTKNN
jgi:hypothetical protein